MESKIKKIIIFFLNIHIGTFNALTMIEHFVLKVLANYMKENRFKSLLCFFDQAKCHFNEAFLRCLRSNNIHFMFILASMTGKNLQKTQ
jgi:hypothetical protein